MKKKHPGLYNYTPQKTSHSQIWTYPRPTNLGQLNGKNDFLGSGPFSGAGKGLKIKITEKKIVSGDIHLEPPKNLTWPYLNKPTTSKFGRARRQKWLFLLFLGFPLFSEGWHGPQIKIMEKWKDYLEYSSRVPKNLTRPNLNKPTASKFGATKWQK